jgi:aspartate racemase
MTEVIGILGGMGPAATADFYTKLVQMTVANRDQDHPRVVIWADPTVPDRTEALLGRGPDPTEALIAGARALGASGATLLAVPCNTAHAFAPAAAAAAGLPLVHMVDEVADHLRRAHPRVSAVGLLATTGTITAGLYQHALRQAGITTIVPDPQVQDHEVMGAIRDIKAGARPAEAAASFERAADTLVDRGAQALLAGCTEVPLALDGTGCPAPLVDPALVLAAAVLRRCGNGMRAWGRDPAA